MGDIRMTVNPLFLPLPTVLRSKTQSYSTGLSMGTKSHTHRLINISKTLIHTYNAELIFSQTPKQMTNLAVHAHTHTLTMTLVFSLVCWRIRSGDVQLPLVNE